MTDTNASPQIDTMPNLTWRDFLLDTAPVHVSYFREPVNGKHILCHTLVAIDVDAVAYVGISMCHETDAFSRPKGKAIAYGRAQKLLGSVRMNAQPDTKHVEIESNPDYKATCRLPCDNVRLFVRKLREMEAKGESLVGAINLFLADPMAWDE